MTENLDKNQPGSKKTREFLPPLKGGANLFGFNSLSMKLKENHKINFVEHIIIDKSHVVGIIYDGSKIALGCSILSNSDIYNRRYGYAKAASRAMKAVVKRDLGRYVYSDKECRFSSVESLDENLRPLVAMENSRERNKAIGLAFQPVLDEFLAECIEEIHLDRDDFDMKNSFKKGV